MDDSRFAKFLVILNGLVPLSLLGWDAYHHQLGANAVNDAIRTTGILTLVFLPLSLLVTPLRWITNWRWLLGTRRWLGLYAFFYGSIHFSLFFWFDRAHNVSSTLHEMLVRKYLIVGSIGLLVMVPLAITSTSSMIRLLGAMRWKALHRLAYVAAAAGVLHYYMLVKAGHEQPIAFGAAVGALLAYRAVHASNAKQKQAAAMPASRVAGRDGPWSGELIVADIRPETPNVKTFTFKPESGEFPFRYLPGQYLSLKLNIDGKSVSRSYTIASTPSRAGSIQLSIKREEMGTVSRFLHDRLRPGDRVRVLGPAGRFTFTGTEAEQIVLLGGGVGITPLMSVLRYLTDMRWPGKIYLVYSVRSAADIIFAGELEELAARHPNLKLVITVSRPIDETWRGQRGRITADLLRATIPDLATARIHVCGPNEMMDGVREVLKSLSVPDEHVMFENFGAKPTPTDLPMPELPVDQMIEAEADPTPAVRFARSGKRIETAPTQTVLEAAESLKVNIPYDCRSGVCGTCKVRLLAGMVRMDVKDALDSGDEEKGLILACQAVAEDGVVVDA